MFLKLKHTDWKIYGVTKRLVIECNNLIKVFPKDEKYVLTNQISRAALSVHLNLAEGASRKSPKERKRFYEVSRSSVIEIDTAFDIAVGLNYCTEDKLKVVGDLIQDSFVQLTKLINTNASL